MLDAVPEKLNPVIRPVMDCIKKEENEQLQVQWNCLKIMWHISVVHKECMRPFSFGTFKVRLTHKILSGRVMGTAYCYIVIATSFLTQLPEKAITKTKFANQFLVVLLLNHLKRQNLLMHQKRKMTLKVSEVGNENVFTEKAGYLELQYGENPNEMSWSLRKKALESALFGLRKYKLALKHWLQSHKSK